MNSFSPLCPVDAQVLCKADGEAFVRKKLAGQACRMLVLVPRILCTELSLAAFFTALQGDGHCLHLVTDIPANPDVAHLADLLAQLRRQRFHPTCVLAIGGGSCMDLAKGVSALWHLPTSHTASPQGVREAISGQTYAREGHLFLDIVAMPTTAGTGSEVTHWATVWDAQNNRKLSIDCVSCFPRAAVLIPEWTAGMPVSLTLSTGLDALSHAMEAFWAKARSPLSQALALDAVARIVGFLPKALAAPQDVALRQEMCLGSLLAGLAFSQTRTTACHSLSYPLTLLHGVPHGFAAALFLAPVMARNQAVLPEIQKLSILFEPSGGLASWLQSTCHGIQDLTLSAFGIGAQHLPALADLAFTTGRMDNNPVAFDRADCLAILKECL